MFQYVSAMSEASLIVPDFTNSEYGSSCKDIFFGLILTPLLSLSILGIPKAGWDAKIWIKKENKRKEC